MQTMVEGTDVPFMNKPGCTGWIRISRKDQALDLAMVP